MGYSVYITRREAWSDFDGPGIALSEWLSLVDSDPELRWEPDLGEHLAVWVGSSSSDLPWLAWENGNLESKHPEKAMLRKMYEISETLSAQLMGEEGEGYDRNGEEIASSASTGGSARPGLWQRVRAFFTSSAAPDPGFPVGCRVRDALGRSGRVEAVDLRSSNGLGSILVRYDDGRSASFAAVAHGLERVDHSAGGI
jgi:hypothetical protein